MCACVRGGYGRACGCTACDAHVRAIARADDAAVAITCARGPVRRYIKANAHVMYNKYVYTYIDAKSGYVANAYVMYNIYVDRYRCKVRVCKWVRNVVLACACDRVRALTMR